MKNQIVEFLASYGPQPAANNLYDEFVLQAAKKYDCEPLEIEQPLVQELIELFRSDNPVSVILTGTAGDGKTYTARKVAEELGNSPSTWENTQKIFELNIDGIEGRKVRIIKDLSELNEIHKNEVFDDIRNALLGNSDDLFLICVNDGLLLKFFRDRGEQGLELKNRITDMLQNDSIEDPGENFRLYNMSRQSHQELYDKIVDEIVAHPKWEDCAECPIYNNSENPCPIRGNLEILKRNDNSSMRARLKDLIRMAAADRQHLSIRQLILLTVNTLLGDSKQGRRLLNCNTARKRASDNDYRLTNPFANVFGENLTVHERFQYGAFEVISRFGIGNETNNYFDDGLFRNSSELPQDPLYGQRIFEKIREQYRVDPASNATEFQEHILNQRRRLFFTMEPCGLGEMRNKREDLWNLTEFKHGATYIAIVESLSKSDGKVPSAIRCKLVCGLNRMMTGEMTTTDDRIWLSQPSGVFRGHEIPLLVELAGPQNQTSTFVSFPELRRGGKAPVLEITPNRKVDLKVSLELRPTLIECLLRIAEGALPSSFTSECSQEIKRFQLRTSASIQKAHDQFIPPLQLIHMVGGKLQSRPIDLIQTEEEW